MKKFKNIKKLRTAKARWKRMVLDATAPLLVEDLGVPRHDIKRDGITQSLISVYMKCPREFLFKMHKLHSEGKRTAFAFGSITHETLDKIYNYFMKHEELPKITLIKKWVYTYPEEHPKWLPISTPPETKERFIAVCYTIVTEYIRHYKKKDFVPGRIIGAEDEFDIKYMGYRLLGKKDLRFNINGGRWIMETKTASRIVESDYMESLGMNFQNLFYVLAEEIESQETCHGVLYNVVRNPGLKFKNSLEEYCNRIRRDIRSRPDFYFIRYEIPYTSDDKKLFKQDLDEILPDICIKLMAGTPKSFWHNRRMCVGKFKCSFLPVCTSGKLIGYTQGESLFPELENVD